jgi:serine/threonine protein kinase
VDAWEERASLYIQTELCELGSLKDFMYKHGPLSEDQIWSFLTDMLLVPLSLSLVAPPPIARTDHRAK